jgi:hypothetical protein
LVVDEVDLVAPLVRLEVLAVEALLGLLVL